jgi:transglutaminase-like putative cysteine protease
VTFAREKRLLIGLAALGVALPLPLNQALEWPVLALFMATVALFLRRAWRGSERWLSDRALNLIGLGYLPVLVLDVFATGRIQPVRPVLHLTLFGVAVKLWSLTREKDKWQAWVGIFFVFLAAMATSTHPAVVAYLVGYLVLTLVVLARFVQLHVAAAWGGRTTGPQPLPGVGVIATMAVATAVLAVPLFAVLPRVRSPFVVGPGAVGGGEPGRRMGFTDDINLDLVGRLRENREIAFRMDLDGRHPDPTTMRFRAGVYEAWLGRTWRTAPGARALRRQGSDSLFRLAAGAAVGRARIALEPQRSTALVLPVESLAVDAPAPRLQVSNGGAVALGGMPGQVFEYTAVLGSTPVSAAAPPAGRPGTGALSAAGITAEMTRLAAEWAGDGAAAERARRIERRLKSDFAYTTEFVGRSGASPIEDFLFRERRGHCEYFASAMVLLLRAQGIPARLATGFYGAEWSTWEQRWVVRQSNAHAWVEAWLPERGWTIFDPTPDAGLPRPEPRGALTSLRQAWEAVVFRWDRWVISYDFEDQVGALGAVRAWWSDLMRRLAGDSQAVARAAAPGGAHAQAGPESPEAGARRRSLLVAALVVALAGAVLGAWLALRRRAEWTTVRAYGLLRAELAAAGLPVADSLAPLALDRLVARRLPAAAPAASRLVAAYVGEVFAARPLSDAARAALRADLTAVEQAAHEARRRSRRAGARGR